MYAALSVEEHKESSPHFLTVREKITIVLNQLDPVNS